MYEDHMLHVNATQLVIIFLVKRQKYFKLCLRSLTIAANTINRFHHLDFVNSVNQYRIVSQGNRAMQRVFIYTL